jgi:hypothetical protein
LGVLQLLLTLNKHLFQCIDLSIVQILHLHMKETDESAKSSQSGQQHALCTQKKSHPRRYSPEHATAVH